MLSMTVVKPFRMKTSKWNAHSRTAVAVFLFHSNLLYQDTTSSPQVEKECDLAAGQHLASDENCFPLQSFLDQIPLPNYYYNWVRTFFLFAVFCTWYLSVTFWKDIVYSYRFSNYLRKNVQNICNNTYIDVIGIIRYYIVVCIYMCYTYYIVIDIIRYWFMCSYYFLRYV